MGDAKMEWDMDKYLYYSNPNDGLKEFEMNVLLKEFMRAVDVAYHRYMDRCTGPEWERGDLAECLHGSTFYPCTIAEKKSVGTFWVRWPDQRKKNSKDQWVVPCSSVTSHDIR